MALKKITKITNKQIAEKGVQALADRPNLTAQYGASGLSAAQLKLWFDKLATFLAERINEISDAISSDDATNYIRVCLDEYGVDNLGALITAFTDGDFAAKILKVYSSASQNRLVDLQTLINTILKALSDSEEKLETHTQEINGLQENTLSQDGGTVKGDLRVEGTLKAQKDIDVCGWGRIYADISGMYFEYDDLMAGKRTVYLPDVKYGRLATYSQIPKTINLSLDPITYELTVKLLFSDGWVASSQTVDLPIESLVMDLRYDSAKEALIVALKNGEEREIPASSIFDAKKIQQTVPFRCDNVTVAGEVVEGAEYVVLYHNFVGSANRTPIIGDCFLTAAMDISTFQTVYAYCKVKEVQAAGDILVEILRVLPSKGVSEEYIDEKIAQSKIKIVRSF